MKSLVTVADDFGMSVAINEAVEEAARHGILTSASLMVAGRAAPDAIRRAIALGGRLRVGLHLVAIEGPALLPPAEVAALMGPDGEFPSDQLKLGLAYAFHPTARRQLRAEIAAQFAAFAVSGLKLDHANAHKHMHLHPFVGHQMISIGREHGLRAIRVPAEPALQGATQTLADRALLAWTRVLRWQARRAGLRTSDQVFGLSDTGHMTPARVRRLIGLLPGGVTELYFHPATMQDDLLRRLMPGYEHQAELAALLETRLPPDVRLTSYSALDAG